MSERLNQVSNIVEESATKYNVCVVGSGNWGTTIAKIASENCLQYSDSEFNELVKMWVYEEEIDGQKLTEIINTKHQNVKYLPNIDLPHNLVASPDLIQTLENADIVIFNIPHQFLGNIVKQVLAHCEKENIKFKGGLVNKDCIGISCLKGFHLDPTKGVTLLNDYVTETLDIPCGALSGANLAPEVAKEKWSETTVAFDTHNNPNIKIDHNTLKKLFHRPYFHVNVIDDVAGVSVAGALKNVVAVGCGIVLGLGWGDNASAAIQRIGLSEIIAFGKKYFPECSVETYYKESAGVADLITTCSGGRNVRVATAFAKENAYAMKKKLPTKSVFDIEKEILNGQSAQGIITCKETHEWLVHDKSQDEFPLFEAVYHIIYEGANMKKLPEMIEDLQGLEVPESEDSE
ncbi:glycerol-3-phosphate dehydrogenase [Hanseniaspora osmophila]